jgi:uncharacterized membrane protein
MSTNSFTNRNISPFSRRLTLNRGLMFGVLIVGALFAFEIFNYSTTDYALGDLLGDLRFAGTRWATILAIAFCGIDFAGIARLFTPEQGAEEPKEVWYLFGAWLLAATMNAMLTWWGVSIAILNHQTLGNVVVSQQTLLKIVPIFVAVMVWLIRVLIIGTFSVAGDRLFSEARTSDGQRLPSENQVSIQRISSPRALASQNSFRPAPKNLNNAERGSFIRPEPTYHPVSMRGPNEGRNNVRR